MSKLTPLGDRVLVQPDITANKLGSIFIPEKSREKPQTGMILEVGSDVKDIKVGDKVLYGKHSGTEVTFEGEKLVVMRDGDCFAIIK